MAIRLPPGEKATAEMVPVQSCCFSSTCDGTSNAASHTRSAQSAPMVTMRELSGEKAAEADPPLV